MGSDDKLEREPKEISERLTALEKSSNSNGKSIFIATIIAGLAFILCIENNFRVNNLKNVIAPLPYTNVIGDSRPEKFYQFGTNKAYVEIDGQRVENYFLENEGGRR